MDAECLAIREAAFDAVLFLFVLFHIPNPIAALQHALRAMRPGGTLGLVVWGADPGLPGGAIWREELDRLHAAEDPRDPSVMRQSWMDTPEKLRSLLEQSGFIPERVWSCRFAHQWTPSDLIATQIRCGLTSRRLDTLPSDARKACTERVRARLEALDPIDLSYRVEAVYGLARRPDRL